MLFVAIHPQWKRQVENDIVPTNLYDADITKVIFVAIGQQYVMLMIIRWYLWPQDCGMWHVDQGHAGQD